MSFWGLWHVRYYMVFMCLPPILMGLFGVGSGRVPKILWCALFILFGALGWVAFRGGFQEAANIGAEALELGTSKIARDYNARSGSGVQFDSDSGLSTAVLKLVYTLFAPFPWQEGSIGLQLGKVEALLCYYFYFHGSLGIRKSAATNRNSVLVLLLFIVPATIAYSASMSNVGLMVRQRMPIVMVFGLLASLSPTMARRRIRDVDPPKEKNPRFPRRGLSPHFG
jgi:hypothetical protein